MTIERVEYHHDTATLEAFIAQPEGMQGQRPAVLLMHAWRGRDEFVEKKAQEFASKGYVGIALDNYGKGIVGRTTEENIALMSPLMQDRSFLAARLQAGIQAVKQLSYVDHTKLVVIGYCFGGLCALDILRNNVALAGVISVHGLLGAPEQYAPQYHLDTKVLALTGYNDPMVLPEQTAAFSQEMNHAGVDWQLVTFGKTLHAFTNPIANDHTLGTVYNPIAAKRTDKIVDQFIAECV